MITINELRTDTELKMDFNAWLFFLKNESMFKTLDQLFNGFREPMPKDRITLAGFYSLKRK